MHAEVLVELLGTVYKSSAVDQYEAFFRAVAAEGSIDIQLQRLVAVFVDDVQLGFAVIRQNFRFKSGGIEGRAILDEKLSELFCPVAFERIEQSGLSKQIYLTTPYNQKEEIK